MKLFASLFVFAIAAGSAFGQCAAVSSCQASACAPPQASACSSSAAPQARRPIFNRPRIIFRRR
jgi:hypothetical protein